MPISLRLTLPVILVALSLSACGRTVQEDAPEVVTSSIAEEEAVGFDEVSPESQLRELMLSFRESLNQVEIEQSIATARASDYTDLQIAEAMGMAWLRSPQRRVMISVVFVRFKSTSQTSAAELDAAHEYGRTPPAVREAEANAAEEEVLEEEESPRRRRGWFSWIPGL